ncbi:MAG: signal peptide peptidase SppA [Verrucomicrobiota bacterium]
MKKYALGCIGSILIVALMGSLIVNLVLIVSKGATSSGMSASSGFLDPFEEVVVTGKGSSKEQIGLINVFGVIGYSQPGDVYDSMVDDIIAKIKKAKKDSSIKAVIVRIDSPGGEITASDVIYHHIKQLDEVKPVVIYMDSVAASGGYYSAIAGRYIMANELTITGSIGVIMQTLQFKELMDKIGVNGVTIKSGRLKDLLNPFRDATPEEIQLLQNMIDESYAKFVGLVAEERELAIDLLKSEIADGRILSGKQAQEVGLIDQTGYFEDAIKKTAEIAGISENSQVIRYETPFSFNRLIRIFGKAPSHHGKKVELDLGLNGVQLQPGKLYYIAPTFVRGL